MTQNALSHSHAGYWLSDQYKEAVVGSDQWIRNLAAIRRSIADYVMIATGKKIPVHFSSGMQSYTDGQEVVIAASDKAEDVDVMCGTALHESSHILLSQPWFKFMPTIKTYIKSMISQTTIPQDQQRLNVTDEQLVQHIHFVMNVMEDRRIDRWMYEKNPGWRPFYEAMYERYWHSPEVDELLTNQMSRFPSFENYMAWVINRTNDHFDETALKELDKINAIFDLDNVPRFAEDADKNWKSYKAHYLSGDLDKLPRLFSDAVRMLEIMYRNSVSIETPDKPTKEQKEQCGGGSGQGDLQDWDQISPSQMKKIREALEKQMKFLKGEQDKGKALTPEQQALVDAMGNPSNKMTKVGYGMGPNTPNMTGGRGANMWQDLRAVIYRDVTVADIENGVFDICTRSPNTIAQAAVANGERIGQILANRVTVLQEPKLVEFPHKKFGKLDKRRLPGLGYGVEDIFKLSQIEALKPVHVHMSIDASGSMGGNKFKNALTLAVAFAYVAEKNKSFTTVIDVRTENHHFVQIGIVFDSRRQSFAQLKRLFPYLAPTGGTPEGLAFSAILSELVDNSDAQKKYFVNFSDGMPNGGDVGVDYTAKMVRQMRENGVKILSYFIDEYMGNKPDAYMAAPFRRMYGNDAAFIDPTSIPQLVGSFNKRFLQD